MARSLRVEGAGAVYHITARGDRREKIFRDDQDRERFVRRLVESIERFDVEIHAWVLMGNHFHLLARTLEPNLSRWMQWLLGCYTMDFNRRHGVRGHLFQGRFKAFVVEERGYFAELSRYIHLNPVRGRALGRGEIVELRKRLRKYRWSSYRAYAGLENPPPWLREREVFGELGLGRAKDRRVRYRRFVEQELARKLASPLEMAQAQSVLGSEGFVQRTKDLLRKKREGVRRQGVTGQRFLRMKERGEKILSEIASREGMKVEEFCLSERRGEGSVSEAMERLQREAGWSLREIGERMRGRRPAAVAQRIRRFRMSNVKP